jgi:hypothetical protein
MEVPNGEAHGVMAVAINNGILKLPNEDGALKLEITPALINAYSRIETDRLIDQKIYDHDADKYTFIKWPASDGVNPDDITPEQVIDAAIPEGGESQKLYIVGAMPGVPETDYRHLTTSFIWDIVQIVRGQDVYGWVNVNSPTPTEYFTPYAMFDMHRKDEDPNNPDVLHLTREERHRIEHAMSVHRFQDFVDALDDRHDATHERIARNGGKTSGHRDVGRVF